MQYKTPTEKHFLLFIFILIIINYIENKEILPPLKGQNIQSIFDAIDPLMEFNQHL